MILCDHKKMKSSGHMDVVIDAAKRAAAAGEVPVAAAVIDACGQIIVVAENRMKRDAKSTSHAELLALEAAMNITGNSICVKGFHHSGHSLFDRFGSIFKLH